MLAKNLQFNRLVRDHNFFVGYGRPNYKVDLGDFQEAVAHYLNSNPMDFLELFLCKDDFLFQAQAHLHEPDYVKTPVSSGTLVKVNENEFEFVVYKEWEEKELVRNYLIGRKLVTHKVCREVVFTDYSELCNMVVKLETIRDSNKSTEAARIISLPACRMLDIYTGALEGLTSFHYCEEAREKVAELVLERFFSEKKVKHSIQPSGEIKITPLK